MLRSGIASGSVLLLLAAPATAVTQVSNLSESGSLFFQADSTIAHAGSFTTGAVPVRLDSVTVSGSGGTGSVELGLWEGDFNPSVTLEVGTQSKPSPGPALLTYPSAGTVLAPNTTYWVTLGGGGSAIVGWVGTSSTNQSSPSGWTIGDQTLSRATGSSTWLPVNGVSNESPLFSIDATALSDWVEVGDPGNACDPQPQGCFGAVAYPYQISRYEVTNAQFVEFLNAIADDDPNGIWNAGMEIARSGSPGSYSYAVLVGGREQLPVTAVSWYDTLRFANWMHNLQPVGAQGASTTEDGAYTFSGPTTVGPRNPGAIFALATEDEWYKAAHYDGGTAVYFDWPTGTDATPTCSMPSGLGNRANCETAVGFTTDVASYPNSPSPYGTFDQGGNAFEWNETPIGPDRGVRGGSYNPSPAF